MVDKEDNTNNHSYLAYGLERLLPLRQHCSAAREYIYQQYRQLGSVKIRVRPWLELSPAERHLSVGMC